MSKLFLAAIYVTMSIVVDDVGYVIVFFASYLGRNNWRSPFLNKVND